MTRTRPSYGVPRRLGALALAAVLGPLLAGCGGGDTPQADTPASPTAGETSSVAPEPSSPTGDPSASASASEGAGGGEEVTRAALDAVVTAAFDDTMGARLSVENGLGLLGGEGTADFRSTPTALAMQLASTETGDAQQLDVRVVDDTLYVAEGTRWLSLLVDGPSNPFGTSLSDQLDPRFVLGVVRDHLVSATREGSTYTVVADGPAVAEELAPDLAGQTGVVVPPSVTAVLEVGDDGLASRVSVGLGEENGEIDYTLDGWGTGDDLAVSAPPAGQVETLPELPR